MRVYEARRLQLAEEGGAGRGRGRLEEEQAAAAARHGRVEPLQLRLHLQV